MSEMMLPSEFELKATPSAVVDDEYYPENEYARQKEIELKGQIVELAQDLKAWEVNACKLYADGESINAIAKKINRSHKVTRELLETFKCQQIVQLWRAVLIYQSGPNEMQRRNMLWRIAIDNEKGDPKEARGAIAELNRMDDARNGRTGNKIEIVINNELLPRTKLDD